MKLYLVLYDSVNNKEFTKYFTSEFEMDKFKRKLTYSFKLFVIKDSREEYLEDYE